MLSKRVDKMLKSRVKYPLARKYGAKLAGAINLASNESPFGPSPKTIEAIKSGIDRIGSYPDPSGIELKRAIASYIGVDPECVALGNGSDELVDLVCKAFMDPGENVLIPLPTFSIYELACRINGGTPEFFELPNLEWRASELVSAMKDARLAFVGRPNNPTGNGISTGGLRDLLKTGKLVVVDEAYVEFAGYSVAKDAARRENLLVLRTFSKAFGLAGLRVGYAIGTPKLIEALEHVRAPFSVNSLAQVAAIAALRDRRYLRNVISMIRKGRTYLSRELSMLGLSPLLSDANFLMVDVTPLGTDAPALCEFLIKRGIMIRDLSKFRGAGSSWVRVSVGTPEQNEKFVEAMKKFKRGGR
jgi:histidinol-phosphate aminotransferase